MYERKESSGVYISSQLSSQRQPLPTDLSPGCCDLPQTLQKWLLEKDASGNAQRNLQKLKISLGPYNESYFATDGTSTRWLNLPTGLGQALENRRKPGGGWTAEPRLVALGTMSNYIMITDNNGGNWSLPNYKELDAIIDVIKDMEGGLGLIHVSLPFPSELEPDALTLYRIWFLTRTA